MCESWTDGNETVVPIPEGVEREDEQPGQEAYSGKMGKTIGVCDRDDDLRG